MSTNRSPTRSEIPPYPALALQMRCQAINGCASVAAGREQIVAALRTARDWCRAQQVVICTRLAGAGPRLVVLPEYFLTSFPMGESIAQWQALACISG